MAKKQKCPECEEGAPGWMVSFSDMVTLLLCFFIFLLITAKVDVDKLSAAVGYMKARVGLLPQSSANDREKKKERVKQGVTEDKESLVIEEGKKYVLGGAQMFDHNKAVLRTDRPKVTETLYEVSRLIRGLRNIIEIRGHSGTDEGKSAPFRDGMDLSLERARAVRDFLVESGRILKQRIRIVGCSHHENNNSDMFQSTEDKNRRVDVRVTERFQDFYPSTKL